jgi:lysophospholipase L1-like esterase
VSKRAGWFFFLLPFLTLALGEAWCRRDDSWRKLSFSDPYWVSFLGVKKQFDPPQDSAQVRRIFCLGGSVVAGYPFPHAGFPEWMDYLLKQTRQPYVAYQLGGPSYGTRRTAHVLAEVLSQHPWAVVICAGHNDPMEEAIYRHIPAWLRGPLGQWLWRSALVTNICRAAGERAKKRAPQPEGTWGLPSSLPALPRTEVLEGYRARLRALVRDTRSAGALPIVCTTPVNPRFPPIMVSTKDLAPEDAERLREALRLWQAKRPAAARAVGEKIPAAKRNPYVHWILGRCRLAEDRPAEAAREFALADEANPTASDEVRQVQRQVAVEEGAVLVDLDREWRRLSPDSLPPDDFFSDNHHLSLRGYQDAAFRILHRLEETGHLPGGTARLPAIMPLSTALRELGQPRELEAVHHALLANEFSLYGDCTGWDWFHELAINHMVEGLRLSPKIMLGRLRRDHPAVRANFGRAQERF